MSDRPLIVLKFGGSVLLDEQTLRIAVHEIYRWRREGWRVLAVVSALAGRTESLVARCAAVSPSASQASQAGVIGLGEYESAGLLGVHLDRVGVPATVLTPCAIGLFAAGDALDADLVSVHDAVVHAALEACGVVVVPGFVARAEGGELVTLGRGGSDLTAVFLAHQLGAQKCRLIKDVDGLYERDPAVHGPKPGRYGYASYDDALATDGSILQHKAIDFARSHGQEIELGRFNGTRPTRIGPGQSVHDNRADTVERLDVALCGLGTVGGGVLDLVSQLPDQFCVVGAACASPEKHVALEPLAGRITADAVSLASCGADVVVEVIGGVDVAWAVTEAAIDAGCSVVSANKALLAARGDEIATRCECGRFLASASVGGVTPVLEAIQGREVVSIRGVLNGTGNFVLGALQKGPRLHEAVAESQRLGFAEADPSRDLDGRDSLDKLLVIAQTLGWLIDHKHIERQSITEQAYADVIGRSDGNAVVRHVAMLTPRAACVRLEAVTSDDPLASLTNEWNAAVISFADGSETIVRGKGAGRWPTAESVLADLLALSRTRCGAPDRQEVVHA